MKVLDLHNYQTKEAIKETVAFLNSNLNQEIKIIHGYGSSGKGGILKEKIRNFLEKNEDKMEIHYGERLRFNPGCTIVKLKKKITDNSGNDLKDQIKNFCTIAKPKEKIYNKFFKINSQEIDRILKELETEKVLQQIKKRGIKCYISL